MEPETEPEPDRIDLSALDPSRNRARWEGMIASVVERAHLRRRILRRGGLVVALAAAAMIAMWLAAPPRASQVEPADILSWATRDVGADDVLALGGR